MHSVPRILILTPIRSFGLIYWDGLLCYMFCEYYNSSKRGFLITKLSEHIILFAEQSTQEVHRSIGFKNTNLRDGSWMVIYYEIICLMFYFSSLVVNDGDQNKYRKYLDDTFEELALHTNSLDITKNRRPIDLYSLYYARVKDFQPKTTSSSDTPLSEYIKFSLISVPSIEVKFLEKVLPSYFIHEKSKIEFGMALMAELTAFTFFISDKEYIQK